VRRAALGVVLLLTTAAPAAASPDLGTAQGGLADARAEESQLTAQITDLTAQIRTLERREVDVSRRLAVLKRDLALHRQRLDRLTELYRVQTDRLIFLRGQYRLAVDYFSRRLVDLYEGGDVTSEDVVLSAGSFRDLVDQLDYVDLIAEQDARISNDVHQARIDLRVGHLKTKQSRVGVAGETRVIAVRTYQVRQIDDRLLAAKHRLSRSRRSKRSSLAAAQVSEKAFLDEVNGLRSASRAVAARARAAAFSAPVDRTVSSHGFIWPVNGPVTSPFGWRWGRIHEGIDIGVGYGTPIHAAGAGTVIYAGWESGYGNFVLIDHGGGLSTAYGHQSAIAVHVGQRVSQGQVIGYVGCTGHCFGPHLHFEVRVNGTAVDPLGYL
jgi:murein DD-endopeptidase MepM/ murein hydrolase activator NlpD